MKPSQCNHLPDTATSAEETLRLIASLPAPDGLVDRVQAGLRTAPSSAHLFTWPFPRGSGWMHTGALRAAAAAAIVCLVAGGGWGIYSHVQPGAAAGAIPRPARVGPAGGFSSAGAMRTPNTLQGPILTHPIAPVRLEPRASDAALEQAPKAAAKAKKAKKADASGPVVPAAR